MSEGSRLTEPGALAELRETRVGRGPVNDDLLSFTVPPELIEVVARRAAQLVLAELEERAQAAPRASPVMSIPEAAVYIRCNRSRIDNLLSEGRLARHKDGSSTLLLRAEIDRHLAGELVGPVVLALPSAARGRLERRAAGWPTKRVLAGQAADCR